MKSEVIENEGKPEEVLQDFLEEYVFQQGYYPISQAQLGRGRLDALVHTPSEASFLVEAKQVGLGNSQESVTARRAIQKIEEAIDQAQSYQHRLAGYTAGSDVYVVLFSARYLIFNDPLPIKRGGLNFFAEIVNLIDKPVTEWGKPELLSLERRNDDMQMGSRWNGRFTPRIASNDGAIRPERVTDLSSLSSEIERAFSIACAEAQQQNSPIVGTPHLFIALTKLNGEAATALRGQGHDPKQIRDGLRAALGPGQAAPGAEPKLTARAAQNLQRATELAEAEGAAQVEERHLLAAILEDDPESFTLRALRDLGVDVAALRSWQVCGGHADFGPGRPRSDGSGPQR